MHPRPSTRRAFLRRAGSAVLLATASGGLLAGCDDGSDPPSAATGPEATADGSPDEALVSRALDDTTALLAAYDAVLGRHRRLRPTLSGPRSDLKEHLDVLSGVAGDVTTAPGTHPPVPRSARASRRRLADLEGSLVDRRRRDAITAESGDLGRLLAAIAASHAQHRALLGERSREHRAAPPDPATATIEGDPVVDAMNATLAGEHAAIYAYGVIGGRLDIDSPPVRDAIAASDVHLDRRDGLIALVEAAGGRPVAAEAGYLLPRPVNDLAGARATAQLVEDRCGVLYATLAGTSTREIRAYAVDALIDSATRGLAWGAVASPLPGLVDGPS